MLMLEWSIFEEESLNNQNDHNFKLLIKMYSYYQNNKYNKIIL